MKTCVNCGTRVIARADGTCPSCREAIDVKSDASVAAPAEPPAKAGSGMLPMLGPVLGVVVAAVLMNRTPSGGVDGMTIVTALAALVGGVVGIFAVRALLAALRRRS